SSSTHARHRAAVSCLCTVRPTHTHTRTHTRTINDADPTPAQPPNVIHAEIQHECATPTQAEMERWFARKLEQQFLAALAQAQVTWVMGLGGTSMDSLPRCMSPPAAMVVVAVANKEVMVAMTVVVLAAATAQQWRRQWWCWRRPRHNSGHN